MTCTVGTAQAARIAGATVRMVDYWCSTSVIIPHTPASGRGRDRAFEFMDVLRLRILVQLRNAAIPLQTIRRALERLEEWQQKDPLASGRLLAVAGRLFWIESDVVLIDLQQGQKAMADVILLDLAEMARKTESDMLEACAA